MEAQITLTWIPSSKTQRKDKSAKSETYDFSMPKAQIEGRGFWEALRNKLSASGKSPDVSFVLEEVLTKFQDGKPVYTTLFLGSAPGDNVFKEHKLENESYVRVSAFESA